MTVSARCVFTLGLIKSRDSVTETAKFKVVPFFKDKKVLQQKGKDKGGNWHGIFSIFKTKELL